MAAREGSNAGNGSKRFATLTEDHLLNIVEAKESKNTKQATKHARDLFREYLMEKGLETDFENFEKNDLNTRLRTFYAEMRNKDGEMYKRTSTQAIRSGLRRFVCQSTDVDIVSDPSVSSANEMFQSVCKDAYKKGLGAVDHKQPIAKSDLQKLYSSIAFDVKTPCGRVNKVWFELCMYFCRRGRENQRELKPDMFEIAADASGKRLDLKYQKITRDFQIVILKIKM